MGGGPAGLDGTHASSRCSSDRSGISVSTLDTPLEAVLRDHGASIAVRHGHRVAVHFGSVGGETAVCVRSVGLTDRFGRITFEVRGAPTGIEAALARIRGLDGQAWAARLRPDQAIVRCEPISHGHCRVALDDPDLLIEPTSRAHAALGLVGPLAGDVLRDAQLERASFRATILTEPGGFEILVPPESGAEAWAHLLRAGGPFGIACVGFDALEHLAVSRQLAKS
jgi:glycine cleavage system aminomethyltransferase T